MTNILIIMAAGMGSRFGGEKQLAKIGPSEEVLFEYSVYDALRAGFNRIIFVIRPEMENAFRPLISNMKAAYPDREFFISYQGDKNSFDGIALPSGRIKPLGTVHAVLSSRQYISSHFAVINADDFYGRTAFEELLRAIESFDEAPEAALVAYELKNTLSPHGPVTRGICSAENGVLSSIREAYKIYRNKEGSIVELIDDRQEILAPETPVSMNMWAFSFSTIPYMEDYLDKFLDGLEADDNKSECLLPIMVDDLRSVGKIKVYLNSTSELWFGLTYRNDAEIASWELDKRHLDGHYPDKLF